MIKDSSFDVRSSQVPELYCLSAEGSPLGPTGRCVSIQQSFIVCSLVRIYSVPRPQKLISADKTVYSNNGERIKGAIDISSFKGGSNIVHISFCCSVGAVLWPAGVNHCSQETNEARRS